MMIEKFNVLNRWTGAVQFTAEIEVTPEMTTRFKMGLAVKWARKNGANLRDTNLSGANLRGADLSGANLSDTNLSDTNLRGANLRGANLSGANLSGADLSGANLRGADLRGANLSGADLRGANLSDTNLSGANLSGANLSGADLSGANLSDTNLRGANLSGANLSDTNLSDTNLSGANLSGANLSDTNLSDTNLSDTNLSGANLSDANLRSFKADLWLTLVDAKAEIPMFIQSMLDGKIDGSQYEGECACLVGTLANVRGISYATAFPDHSSRNPAEQWFLMIKKGDLPYAETGGGFALGKALDWTLEYCAAAGIKLPKPLLKACVAAQDAAKQEQQP
jgi:uncharacterized protein YjbI with pentapeptide repeats